MDMRNWKARRAGGRITITGSDVTASEPAKIVGVDEIFPGRTGGVIAKDKGGGLHVLFLNHQPDAFEPVPGGPWEAHEGEDYAVVMGPDETTDTASVRCASGALARRIAARLNGVA